MEKKGGTFDFLPQNFWKSTRIEPRIFRTSSQFILVARPPCWRPRRRRRDLSWWFKVGSRLSQEVSFCFATRPLLLVRRHSSWLSNKVEDQEDKKTTSAVRKKASFIYNIHPRVFRKDLEQAFTCDSSSRCSLLCFNDQNQSFICLSSWKPKLDLNITGFLFRAFCIIWWGNDDVYVC